MPNLNRTLTEHVKYPPHPPRVETPLFRASRQQMIDVEDLPCRICGVRKSTIGDPTHNRWGAKVMEAHHWYIEDSLLNAIDLNKFNAQLRLFLLTSTGDHAKYDQPFTQDQLAEWVHGDQHNLRILCDTHHLGKLVGIHSITAPIWNVQDLLIDGYDLTGFMPVSPIEGAALTALPATTGTPEPA